MTKRDATGGIANDVYQAILEAELFIVADPLALPPGYVEILQLYMDNLVPHGFPEALGLAQALLQGPVHLFPPAAFDWFLVQQTRRGKGRLIVFSGAWITRNDEPAPCPLADFLKRYGVEARKDLLLAVPSSGTILVREDPYLSLFVRISEQADQQWRAGLSSDLLAFPFLAQSCRSIEPASGSDYVVNPLLQTRFPIYTLEEKLLSPDPAEHWQRILQLEPEVFKRRIKAPPHSIAVTVRERSSRVPRDPFHAGVSGEGTPRLVVFGTATLARAAGVNDTYFNLILSSLAWLRQRTELMDVGIPPRQRKIFEPGSNFHTYSMTHYLLQSLFVFGLVIVGGVGVYLVRRH
ncbi:hypothetical protein HRbin36_01373 [bacterium HR36]|nr:hypothetical protein HRbin36_01373 [bacterium HR36]